jgi:hypothetical protein
MARLDGKVALITGSGTGIGRATARAMAANGAKVVVAELNSAAGEQTAQIIVQAGGHCIAITTDISQEDSMRAAIDTAVRHYGGLHVLHNNAGGSTPADNTVVEAPIEEFWRAIRLDLFGTFLGCRFGIPAIVASGGGSVINMASNVGRCWPRLLHRRKGRDCGDHPVDGGGVRAPEGASQRDSSSRDDDGSRARPVRGRQSARDEDRGGALNRSDPARGHREHGCVSGIG